MELQCVTLVPYQWRQFGGRSFIFCSYTRSCT